jgi:hypothetical protein
VFAPRILAHTHPADRCQSIANTIVQWIGGAPTGIVVVERCLVLEAGRPVGFADTRESHD